MFGIIKLPRASPYLPRITLHHALGSFHHKLIACNCTLIITAGTVITLTSPAHHPITISVLLAHGTRLTEGEAPGSSLDIAVRAAQICVATAERSLSFPHWPSWWSLGARHRHDKRGTLLIHRSESVADFVDFLMWISSHHLPLVNVFFPLLPVRG